MLNILLILIFLRPLISSLAFPYLNYIHSGLLLLFLGAWLFTDRVAIAKIKVALYPLGLFCLALILSVLFSYDLTNSLKELYKYACGLLLFVTASSHNTKDIKAILKTLLLGGFLIAILAIYQYFFSFRNLLNYLKQENINSAFVLDYIARRRVFFPFVTPNTLGGYLAMIAPLALLFRNRILSLAPILAAIFLSGSLGAIASLFLAALFYLCLKRRFNKRHLIYFLGILIILGLILISRITAQQPHNQPAFSAVMRLNYWKETLDIIKAHYLVGIGIGNFNLTHARYAHNSYLQIWAEMGILGVISILWFIIYAWWVTLKNHSPDNKLNLLLTCVLVFSIHNLVDFSFFLPEVSLIWWLILGIVIKSAKPEATGT